MTRLLVQATLLAYLANCSLLESTVCSAQQPPANTVQLSLISDEFDLPVAITSTPFRPDEIVIVERDGLAKSVSKKDRFIREILDIEDLVHETHQYGLMSISYSSKIESGVGEFFANYIDTQGDLVIARFPDRSGKLVDDEQMSVVIKIAQISPNSYGSQVQTSSDNSLLVTTSDGGEQSKKTPHAAQSARSLLGKVLRLIPQTSGGYTAPKDNPFSADTSALPEIWARGFCNPDHISKDSVTGDVFVIDNSAEFLEVNIVQAGKNYGWDEMDGSKCRNSNCSLSSFTTPALSIPRSSPDARLIGGAVYRGKKIPSLTGRFIFAEATSATLFAAEPGTDRKWLYSAIATIPKKEISAIGRDASGEIYVATRDGSLFEIGERGN